MKSNLEGLDYIKHFLRNCVSEALNPRNDGWVQKHYRDQIKAVGVILTDSKSRLVTKPAYPEQGMKEL